MSHDQQKESPETSAFSSMIDKDWSFSTEEISDESTDENDLDPRSKLMNACDEVEKTMRRQLKSQMKGIMKIMRDQIEKKHDEFMEKDRQLKKLEKEMKDNYEKKDEVIEKLERKIKEIEDSRNELSKRLAEQNEEANDKIRILSQQNEELKNIMKTYTAMEEDSWKLENEEKDAQKDMEKKKQELAMRNKRFLMEMNSKDGPTAAKKVKEGSKDDAVMRIQVPSTNMTVDPPTCNVPAAGGCSFHKLFNAGAERVVFRVKSTKSEEYQILPSGGFIEPYESRDVGIFRIVARKTPIGAKVVIHFAVASTEATDTYVAWRAASPAGVVTIPITTIP